MGQQTPLWPDQQDLLQGFLQQVVGFLLHIPQSVGSLLSSPHKEMVTVIIGFLHLSTINNATINTGVQVALQIHVLYFFAKYPEVGY